MKVEIPIQSLERIYWCAIGHDLTPYTIGFTESNTNAPRRGLLWEFKLKKGA